MAEKHIDYSDCPKLVKEYLLYLETIKGRSVKTVNGYCIDLKTFFRFIKLHYKLVSDDIEFSKIDISDIDISLIKKISLSDLYEFLHFSISDRSNSAVTRARKVSSIRGFFKHLTNNLNLIEENPAKNLELPSSKKSLPKFLTLEQSIELLESIDGNNKTRDYCIITLFINCGMRLSELVGINLSDIRDNTLRLLGKGNKERIVYLNQACIDAIAEYLKVRNQLKVIKDKNALFLTKNGTRIGNRSVEKIVEANLKKAGLSNMGISPHKLRHTAATIMYQHGNVDIRVLKEILGHVNVGTTEIYTHVSSKQLENAAQSTPLSKIKPKKDDNNNWFLL